MPTVEYRIPSNHRRLVWARLCTVTFLMLSILGCVYQISTVAVLYFQYQTVTAVDVENTNELFAPALSVCIHYQNILNTSSKRGQILEKYPNEFRSNEPPPVHYLQDFYTVRELFENTPPPSPYVIDRCEFRLLHSYRLAFEGGLDCYANFNVTKFYSQDFICYRFELTMAEGTLYRFTNIANSFNYCENNAFSVCKRLATLLFLLST